MEKYARLYGGEWFVSDSRDQFNLVTGCKLKSGQVNKICILGMVLTYDPQTGFLTLESSDYKLSKQSFPKLGKDLQDALIAHVEWPSEHLSAG